MWLQCLLALPYLCVLIPMLEGRYPYPLQIED